MSTTSITRRLVHNRPWALLLTCFLLLATALTSVATAQDCDNYVKPTEEQYEITALLLELRTAKDDKQYFKILREQILQLAEEGRKGLFVSRLLRFAAFDKVSGMVGGNNGIVPESVLAEILAAYENGYQRGAALAVDLGPASGNAGSDRWNDISLNRAADYLAEGLAPTLGSGMTAAEEARQAIEIMVELELPVDIMIDVTDFLASIDQLLAEMASVATVGGWDWEDFGDAVVNGAGGGFIGGAAATLTIWPGGVAGAVVGGLGGAAAYTAGQLWRSFLNSSDLRHRDHDGDGIPNWLDSDYPVSEEDWDGDGVDNDEDCCPHNHKKSGIAPWTEPPYTFLTGGLYSSLTSDGSYDFETFNPESGFLSLVADYVNTLSTMSQEVGTQP